MITVREEKPGDEQQIRIVNQSAFDRTEEADIVDKLRQSCNKIISLVAISGNQDVDHILFMPVTIRTKDRTVEGMGLGPMAVLPEFHRKGIGSRLVRAGVDLIERGKYPFIIVLGHSAYYSRFGFVSASGYGIKIEYGNVPDEAFMILVLDQAVLEGVSGVAKYHTEFSTVV
jgi:putative acetyltransferase